MGKLRGGCDKKCRWHTISAFRSAGYAKTAEEGDGNGWPKISEHGWYATSIGGCRSWPPKVLHSTCAT